MRPLLVAERLAWLTQATFAFNVKLIDYLRGWPEASEPERAKVPGFMWGVRSYFYQARTSFVY